MANDPERYKKSVSIKNSDSIPVYVVNGPTSYVPYVFGGGILLLGLVGVGGMIIYRKLSKKASELFSYLGIEAGELANYLGEKADSLKAGGLATIDALTKEIKRLNDLANSFVQYSGDTSNTIGVIANQIWQAIATSGEDAIRLRLVIKNESVELYHIVNGSLKPISNMPIDKNNKLIVNKNTLKEVYVPNNMYAYEGKVDIMDSINSPSTVYGDSTTSTVNNTAKVISTLMSMIKGYSVPNVNNGQRNTLKVMLDLVCETSEPLAQFLTVFYFSQLFPSVENVLSQGNCSYFFYPNGNFTILSSTALK